MTDPTLAVVPPLEDSELDRERQHWIDDNRAASMERVQREIPGRFADAIVTVKDVADWVTELVTAAGNVPAHMSPVVSAGPSLLLLGPTGTGKTHQAWGAIRALAASGASLRRWQVVTAADLYARLRPRHGVDSEAEFDRYAKATVLVVDDLGAAKDSEWVEEVNYRLINYRYENGLPTVITSNVPVRELVSKLGERVASRLNEMARRVVLEGADRRRGGLRVVKEPYRPPAPRVVDW